MSTIIDDNTTDMAMEETLISPRFYTTNYKELDKVDVSSIRDEWDPLIEEMRSDPNKRHFQKTSEWDDFDFEDLEPGLRKEFIDFLVSFWYTISIEVRGDTNHERTYSKPFQNKQKAI